MTAVGSASHAGGKPANTTSENTSTIANVVKVGSDPQLLTSTKQDYKTGRSFSQPAVFGGGRKGGKTSRLSVGTGDDQIRRRTGDDQLQAKRTSAQVPRFSKDESRTVSIQPRLSNVNQRAGDGDAGVKTPRMRRQTQIFFSRD